MRINAEKRNTIYQQLPDVLKSIYSSDATIDFQLAILSKYNISVANRDAYLDLTYDVMLGLMPFADLKPGLISQSIVAPLDADPCVRDIKNYIRPLLDYWEAGHKDTKPAGPVNQSLADKINPIEPIRTMENDLKGVHGYGSFGDRYKDETEEPTYKVDQDNVLQKPALTNTPTYTEKDTDNK